MQTLKRGNKGSAPGRRSPAPPAPAQARPAPTWPLVTGAHGVASLAQVARVAAPPEVAVVRARDARQAPQEPKAPERGQPGVPGRPHGRVGQRAGGHEDQPRCALSRRPGDGAGGSGWFWVPGGCASRALGSAPLRSAPPGSRSGPGAPRPLAFKFSAFPPPLQVKAKSADAPGGRPGPAPSPAQPPPGGRAGPPRAFQSARSRTRIQMGT